MLFKRLTLILLMLVPLSICQIAFANAQQIAQQSAQASNSPDKNSQALPIKDVQRFTTALSQIKNYYVEPVTDQELFEDAIRGMLAGLDPHSSYLDEEDFNDLKTSTSGEFTGLGIEVTLEDGLIKVISPIDDTPAQKAGIESGDLIVRLDTTPVRGLSLREAVSKMRGKKGSSIILTVVREGEKKPLEIKVTRDVIQIQSVKSRLFPDNIGYVRISHFQSPTPKDFVKALNQLKQDAHGKLTGLILDLRNNPGGLLDAAIEISDTIIHNDQKGDEELIVYTEGRLPGSEFQAIANPGDLLKGAPIVVLINNGSASGSEIVAGALQDNNRAILLGTKSFGKGSVQTVLPLDDKRAVKLTTALYYTPSGRSIQATGIEPDILVENIKLPTKEKSSNLNSISESQLSGHLANANDEEGDAEKAQSKEDIAKAELEKENKELLAKDYQLHEAFNLIKGLSILKPRT